MYYEKFSWKGRRKDQTGVTLGKDELWGQLNAHMVDKQLCRMSCATGLNWCKCGF